jgi:hypothetical protein
MISTVNSSQHQIIKDIVSLYCQKGIDCDPTYSKGNFYSDNKIVEPWFKSDLYPSVPGVKKCNANNLPLPDDSLCSIMFDPPFIAGFTKNKPSGIMGNRFWGFRYVPDLWKWYTECLVEFQRLLKSNGILIFKCQDTVSSGRQYFSHQYIMNEAERVGLYCKDMFVLTASHRIIGHNHKVQRHARKFHSYFLVFEKQLKAGALHYSLQQTHGGSTSSEVSLKLQQEAATSPC